MKSSLALLFLSLLCAVPTWGCFGPKLYIGVEKGARGDLNFALVSLYIKEKTGVEAVRVDMEREKAAAAVQAGAEVDLAVAPPLETSGILILPDGSPLLAGKRVQEDLQFTTVIPALKKLRPLLAKADGGALAARVQGGEGALAVARAWYKANKAL